MSKPRRFKFVVTKIDQGQDTPTGSPSYLITTTEGLYQTSPHSTIGTSLDPSMRGSVTLTLDDQGRVIQAVPADDSGVGALHTRVTGMEISEGDRFWAFESYLLKTVDGDFFVPGSASAMLSLFNIQNREVDITFDDEGVISLVPNPNLETQDALDLLLSTLESEEIEVDEFRGLDLDEFTDQAYVTLPDSVVQGADLDFEWIQRKIESPNTNN